MKLLWVILSLLIVSPHLFAELTDKDIQRIQEVIQAENKKIHADMVAMELKLTQKIQESENRLRSELNAQFNARMNDFTIVFGVVSGGFFLLFAAVLLINALRGKTPIDRKTISVLILSIITALLCITTAAKGQGNAVFDKITCRNLTIADKLGGKRISLRANRDIALFDMDARTVGVTLTGRVAKFNIDSSPFDITLLTTRDGAGMEIADNRVKPILSSSFMNATGEVGIVERGERLTIPKKNFINRDLQR